MVHVAWPVLGLGLRFAQEKGLHRRKGKQEHTAEDELEKRVFWLVSCVLFDVSHHFNIIHQVFDLYGSLDECFPW